MRDGSQDRRLDRLAAPQPLCLDHVGDELLPFERELEYGAERWHRSLAQSGHGAIRRAGRKQQRAQPPLAHSKGNRQLTLAAGRRRQRDRCPGKLEHGRQAATNEPERVRHGGTRQEQLRHLGCQVSLGSASFSLGGAVASQLTHPARRERSDEERSQRNPVAAVGDREPADRRKVEEVERRRAQQRRRDPEPYAPKCRHDDDAEHVHHAEGGDSRELLEGIHNPRATGDECHRDNHPDHRRRPAATCKGRVQTSDHGSERIRVENAPRLHFGLQRHPARGALQRDAVPIRRPPDTFAAAVPGSLVGG